MSGWCQDWCQSWCQIGVNAGVRNGVKVCVEIGIRIRVPYLYPSDFSLCYCVIVCFCLSIPRIFQKVGFCAFCAVWGAQGFYAGNRCFTGFHGLFLFCSLFGVILYPKSAWRSFPIRPPSAPLSAPHSGAVRLHAFLTVPRCGTDGAGRYSVPGIRTAGTGWKHTWRVEWCRKYKLTKCFLYSIILDIKVCQKSAGRI